MTDMQLIKTLQTEIRDLEQENTAMREKLRKPPSGVLQSEFEKLTFELRIEPGGPMAPMIDALIRPAMRVAAEDLATRIESADSARTQQRGPNAVDLEERPMHRNRHGLSKSAGRVSRDEG